MSFLILLTLLLPVSLGAPQPAVPQSPPNFIVILADDLGYGDLGCYGHPTIRTPQLDRMAAQGQRWTQFYAGESMCTPSRAALLTGRWAIRSGMTANKPRVLLEDSLGGLPAAEITIAEALQSNGYSTACIGKWHLGHLPEFMPRRNGFDYYFGLPYTNDSNRTASAPPMRASFLNPRLEYWDLPLMRNEEIIERPADQHTLTRRYTQEAVKFLEKNVDKPFFLYLAHSMPHLPLFASREFQKKSVRGLYGDVVEELDWSTGQIIDALRRLRLDNRTLVVFTSDNGPWLTFGKLGGSGGLLRGGKGGTYEGSLRVPGIFWWPGTVKPGVVTDQGAALDLFPTFMRLAGVKLPADGDLDGYDLSPALSGTGSSPRRVTFYYEGTELQAVRTGRFKVHFTADRQAKEDAPRVYDLEQDPSEKFNVAEQRQDVIEEAKKLADEHRASIRPAPNQLLMRASAQSQ
ncbi:MAG: sulfatase [Acidobacteriota bacterium]